MWGLKKDQNREKIMSKRADALMVWLKLSEGGAWRMTSVNTYLGKRNWAPGTVGNLNGSLHTMAAGTDFFPQESHHPCMLHREFRDLPQSCGLHLALSCSNISLRNDLPPAFPPAQLSILLLPIFTSPTSVKPSGELESQCIIMDKSGFITEWELSAYSGKNSFQFTLFDIVGRKGSVSLKW